MHRTVFGVERNETVDDDNIADDQTQKWEVHRDDNKDNCVRSLKSEKTMDSAIVTSRSEKKKAAAEFGASWSYAPCPNTYYAS